MVSVTPTARNIESTAESLREDLARLEIQKQALERESGRGHRPPRFRAAGARRASGPHARIRPGPRRFRLPRPGDSAVPGQAVPGQAVGRSRGTHDCGTLGCGQGAPGQGGPERRRRRRRQDVRQADGADPGVLREARRRRESVPATSRPLWDATPTAAASTPSAAPSTVWSAPACVHAEPAAGSTAPSSPEPPSPRTSVS